MRELIATFVRYKVRFCTSGSSPSREWASKLLREARGFKGDAQINFGANQLMAAVEVRGGLAVKLVRLACERGGLATLNKTDLTMAVRLE